MTRLLAGLGVLGIAMATTVLARAPLAVDHTWVAPSIPPETVVARVHHEPVTWSAVAQRLEEGVEMGRPGPSDASTWRAAVVTAIESIVRDVLTRHVAEAAGFTVTEAMIDAAVADLWERHGGDDGLARAMDAMGVSLAELRETQRRGLYAQALIDRFVPATEAAIDAYLVSPGAVGLSREEAAARVRADAASTVIPRMLVGLRADPEVWVIPIETLEQTPTAP